MSTFMLFDLSFSRYCMMLFDSYMYYNTFEMYNLMQFNFSICMQYLDVHEFQIITCEQNGLSCMSVIGRNISLTNTGAILISPSALSIPVDTTHLCDRAHLIAN